MSELQSYVIDVDVIYVCETRDGTAWGVRPADSHPTDRVIFVDKDRCQFDREPPRRGPARLTIEADYAQRKGLA